MSAIVSSSVPPLPPASLRELRPAVARECLRLEKSLLRYGVSRGHSLLLAVSGGADSTALTVILALLAPRQDWRLHVCTVHHGLRAEADAECEQVQHLCAALRLPHHVRHAPVRDMARAAGTGLEETARKARYALLDETRQQTGCHWLLTGHQREDLCEDQIMRLLRGTGWPALGGMPACDTERRLLRPLLHLSGKTLRQWLTDWGIPWSEDSSNSDPAFLRNRLRHTVLPLLERENPSYGESAFRLRQLAQMDADYWESTLDSALALTPWRLTENSITLPRALLCAYPPAVRLRLYLRALRHLNRRYGGQARAERLLALDAAWHNGRGNTRFQFPGGLVAILRGGSVTFGKEDKL